MVLELMISGLCAFARESCKVDNAQAVHVLMLKGHTDHLPRLVVPAKFVKAIPKLSSPAIVAARSPDEVVDLADGTQSFIWNLSGHRLEFVDPPAAIGIWEGRRDPATQEPDYGAHPPRDGPEDFSWVPELHKACNVSWDKAKAKTETLDQDKLPSYALARLMRLAVTPSAANKGNWLEAGIDERWQKAVFGFSANYKQVMADRAKLTMRFADGKPLVIRLVPYATGVTREIHLTPPPMTSTVRASLSNLPTLHEEYVKGDELTHFNAFFELLQPDAAQKCEAPAENKGISAGPAKCTICSVCGGP